MALRWYRFQPRWVPVLSNFEASSNYQTQDPSVIILFKLRDDTRYMAVDHHAVDPPANMGLCVGADISAWLLLDNDMGVTYFVAEPRIEAVTKGAMLSLVKLC